MHVTMLGCPLPIGGANQEAGHTALLWRQAGIDVTVVPTWSIDKTNPWPDRLRAAGCQIIESSPDNLQSVPGLAGGIVSGWCNRHVCEAWPTLQSLGCRVVWSPCMCYWSPHERHAFTQAPPAAVHFQSIYQRGQLTPWLELHACPRERRWLIRGAMDLAAFPFRPKPRDRREFYVGRLSRPDRMKWSRQLFPIAASLRKRRISTELLCMGWTEETNGKCGKAPPWAKTFAPDLMPAQQFLSNCHALLCLNGGAEENWPRVGLEAMAAGVPIVAERRWGWLEMIEDGVTGLLCDTPIDFTNALTRLANDEPFRMSLITNARAAVERLTEPKQIASQWMQLLQNIKG